MKTKPQHNQTPSSRRRGFFSMELTLVLPILGIVLMALFEFSLLFFARGSVVEASRIAARKASLPNVQLEDVRAEVHKVLPPSLERSAQIELKKTGQTGDVVSVAVSVPMKAASPDLLWPVGFSLQNRNLIAETRMIQE